MMKDELLSRIEKLETHQAFQEDVIETLNQTIIQLQTELLKQKNQIRLMVDKVKGMQPNLMASPAEETPPPHY